MLARSRAHEKTIVNTAQFVALRWRHANNDPPTICSRRLYAAQTATALTAERNTAGLLRKLMKKFGWSDNSQAVSPVVGLQSLCVLFLIGINPVNA